MDTKQAIYYILYFTTFKYHFSQRRLSNKKEICKHSLIYPLWMISSEYSCVCLSSMFCST